MKNTIYLVSTKNTNDNMTAQLLEFGNVAIADNNLYAIYTFVKNKEKIEKLPGVIKVQKNYLGEFEF